jgi:hypothetical protein
VNLQIPGVIGVVEADDVPTDLTGSQFQDGETLAEVESWLGRSGQALLGEAIAATRGIMSEGQPASASAPVKTFHGCSGIVVAMVGWVLGMVAITRYPSLDGWGLTNFFFWLFFPIAWVSVAIKRHGCDKDDKSDALAKAHLLQTLMAAKR